MNLLRIFRRRPTPARSMPEPLPYIEGYGQVTDREWNDHALPVAAGGASSGALVTTPISITLEWVDGEVAVERWDNIESPTDASVGALMCDLVWGAVEKDLPEMVAAAIVDVIAPRVEAILATGYVMCPLCLGSTRTKRPSESYTRKCAKCDGEGLVAA